MSPIPSHAHIDGQIAFLYVIHTCIIAIHTSYTCVPLGGILLSHCLCTLQEWHLTMHGLRQPTLYITCIFQVVSVLPKRGELHPAMESVWLILIRVHEKGNCIAEDARDPTDSSNPAPFYRSEGLRNFVSAAPGHQDGISAPWGRCTAKPREASFAGTVWKWCPPLPQRCVSGDPAKAPDFTSLLCTQNGADIQTRARTACLLYKKFDTASVLPESYLFYFLLSDLWQWAY